MQDSDDFAKRQRAATRFRTIALIMVVALLLSTYLGPHYSFFGFAFPVAMTAVALYYFYHRTQQNTDQAVVTLGGLLIVVAWYGFLATAHDKSQHRKIEELACRANQSATAEHVCSEIRNVLATPLLPGGDDPD